MSKEQARKIVGKIISDLCGRSGGDHWFERCDEDIQEEIREAWTKIVIRGAKP